MEVQAAGVTLSRYELTYSIFDPFVINTLFQLFTFTDVAFLNITSRDLIPKQTFLAGSRSVS